MAARPPERRYSRLPGGVCNGHLQGHARAIQDIPYDRINRGTGRRYQSQVYTCRKDEAGRKLDKAAMLVCSKALGHNRISVVADNYIRGL